MYTGDQEQSVCPHKELKSSNQVLFCMPLSRPNLVDIQAQLD
jgi:hypothetical protein